MEEKTYPFNVKINEFRYEFLSISSKKEVQKVVVFTQIGKQVYNLALLDILENGELSDISETKNEDFRIVLATVIQIIGDFLNKNSNYFVAFRGSDEKRQRLYRLIISRELSEISKNFKVLGVIDNILYPFYPNENYDYYLIEKI